MSGRKKIGILTFYHNASNYGGLLQAYALTEIIREMGADVRQISYDRFWDTIWRRLGRASRMSPEKIVRKSMFIIKTRAWRCLSKRQNEALAEEFKARAQAMHRFEERIPHSEQVYNRSNIGECGDLYDIFVVGSDQVWNPAFLEPAFLLDFVPEGKKKIAYAASMSSLSPDRETRVAMEKNLASFDGISVREKYTADLLRKLSGQPVEWLLDPTLLPDAGKWEALSAPRIQEGEYIFCYFLGESERMRLLAGELAVRGKLRIVTLPHIQNHYVPADRNFGDIRLYDVGVEEFLSLIRYAAGVVTDSFHGAVFSEIFRTPYAVFAREGESGMDLRLESLTELFHSDERFIRRPETATAEELEAILRKKTEPDWITLNERREASLHYLRRHLK